MNVGYVVASTYWCPLLGTLPKYVFKHNVDIFHIYIALGNCEYHAYFSIINYHSRVTVWLEHLIHVCVYCVCGVYVVCVWVRVALSPTKR